MTDKSCMITDEQFISMVLTSIETLDRNRKAITVPNINKLYKTFLRFRFEGKDIRELDDREYFLLMSAIMQWNQDRKLRLVVDNSNGNKKEDQNLP